jgi:hypothetical protein
MSRELVAVLVGAIAGGIIALFGSIAQVFIQGWIRDRGRITYDLAGPELSFTIGDGSKATWEKARAYYLSISPAKRQTPHYWGNPVGEISFTANFLNTKGTNAALLEYSILFLKGNQTVLTMLPNASVASAIAGAQHLGQGQAANLAAGDVTAILMQGKFDSVKEAEEVLVEPDSVQFTARLSTGQDIRVELFRRPKRLSE